MFVCLFIFLVVCLYLFLFSQDTARKERRRRIQERRFGLTADKSGVVNAALVDQLVQGGFSRPKAIR